MATKKFESCKFGVETHGAISRWTMTTANGRKRFSHRTFASPELGWEAVDSYIEHIAAKKASGQRHYLIYQVMGSNLRVREVFYRGDVE